MRIVVNLLNFRPGRIGGTETYLRKLIPCMSEVAGEHEVMLLVDRQQDRQGLFPGIARSVLDMSPARVLFERGLEAVSGHRCRTAEKALERMQPDAVLFPQQSMFPKRVSCPSVVVVHDLYHIYRPEYLTAIQRLVRNLSYATSIGRADRIIAISQCTKETVIEHYGVRPDRISVIPHGVGTAACGETPDRSEFGRPYLYYPAASLPHKNHIVLFESIARLKAQGRFNYELVLSGVQTAYWETLRRHIHSLALERTVRHVGFIPYEQVQRLFRGAECILFPTTFEGFGLPVVEAVEARRKVIVSRLKVFNELGVPEQFQIDFADPDQLDAAIRSPGVTVLGSQLSSWQDTARATLELLIEEADRERQWILPFRRSDPVAVPAQQSALKAA